MVNTEDLNRLPLPRESVFYSESVLYFFLFLCLFVDVFIFILNSTSEFFLSLIFNTRWFLCDWSGLSSAFTMISSFRWSLTFPFIKVLYICLNDSTLMQRIWDVIFALCVNQIILISLICFQQGGWIWLWETRFKS